MRSAFVRGAIAVVILGSLSNASAQQAQPSTYEVMSEKFFDMLQHDKSSEAIDYLFAGNPAMKKVPDKIDQLKAQFASLRTLAGPYISHSVLAESKVAGRFVYLHYFVAYERQPISVRITYYRPGATWLGQSLQFDTNVDDVIQKAADNNIQVDAH